MARVGQVPEGRQRAAIGQRSAAAEPSAAVALAGVPALARAMRTRCRPPQRPHFTR